MRLNSNIIDILRVIMDVFMAPPPEQKQKQNRTVHAAWVGGESRETAAAT